MSILSFIRKVCVQDAVYWGSPTPDGYGGLTFDPPKIIKCRWDSVVKNILSDEGKLFVSQAEVLVTEDLEVGGYLYLGDMIGFTNEHRVDPQTVTGAYPIKRITKNPLFRSEDKFVRVVYL